MFVFVAVMFTKLQCFPPRSPQKVCVCVSVYLRTTPLKFWSRVRFTVKVMVGLWFWTEVKVRVYIMAGD